MTLVPVDIAARMVNLARREALWRGILIGFVCGVGAIVGLLRVLP